MLESKFKFIFIRSKIARLFKFKTRQLPPMDLFKFQDNFFNFFTNTAEVAALSDATKQEKSKPSRSIIPTPEPRSFDQSDGHISLPDYCIINWQGFRYPC